MTNGQNVARARHLEDVANASKRYILAEILDVTNAVASELENLGGANDFTGATSIAGGASGVSIDSGNAESTLPAELVAYYLPFESTTTADVCGNTWTATGNASLDSSVKKFGTSSVHLPSQAYLSATDILNLNADKWTFDACFFTSTENAAAFDLGGNGNNRFKGVRLADGLPFGNSTANDWNNAANNWAYRAPTNQWMHVAIVKDGSSLMFFKDDVKKHTYTLQTDIYDPGACGNGLREADVVLNIGRRSFMLTFATAESESILSGGIDMWQIVMLAATDPLGNSVTIAAFAEDGKRILRKTKLEETPPCLSVAIDDLLKWLADEQRNST